MELSSLFFGLKILSCYNVHSSFAPPSDRCMFLCSICLLTYYLELAHAVTEADRSHDLYSVSRRPTRANAGRLKTQKHSVYYFKPQGRKESMSQLKAVRPEKFPYFQESSSFCSIQALNWLEGLSALLGLVIYMLVSSSNTLTDTARIMIHQMSRHLGPGTPWSKLHWHIKLTIIDTSHFIFIICPDSLREQIVIICFVNFSNRHSWVTIMCRGICSPILYTPFCPLRTNLCLFHLSF